MKVTSFDKCLYEQLCQRQQKMSRESTSSMYRNKVQSADKCWRLYLYTSNESSSGVVGN